jgi:iron complex transport system substrate-binding protein
MSGAGTTRRALLAGAGAALLPRIAVAAARPRRIVSLGGAVTEILYRLDRQADIVGVDATSQYPAEALRSKPNVGYVRALGAEGLLSLRPDLILAIEGAGPPDVLKVVAESGIPLTRVPDEPSAAGVLHRIAVVARAVGAEASGEALARSVEARFAAVAEARRAGSRTPRVLVVLSLQNGRPLVGGRGTSADGMLQLAGAVNAAEAVEGWKPLSDEGVIAARPEVVLRVARAGAPADSPGDPFALPAFAGTPAARTRALVAMDGLLLLGFGPRAPEAALDLIAALRRAAATGEPG